MFLLLPFWEVKAVLGLCLFGQVRLMDVERDNTMEFE